MLNSDLFLDGETWIQEREPYLSITGEELKHKIKIAFTKGCTLKRPAFVSFKVYVAYLYTQKTKEGGLALVVE